MRNVLLLSLALLVPIATHAQSTPAQTPPKTGTPAPPPRTGGAPATPAQPRPRTTAPAQPAARSGMALTVLGADGKTIEGVHVKVTGPMERTGDTSNVGQVNFPGLPAGTYRLRFSGDAVITFEREVVLQGGRVTSVQVTLDAVEAKKKEEPKAPVAPPPPAVGPVGSPQWGSLTDLAKRAQQSKPIRPEVLLACSGNSRSVLVLLTEDQPQRVYEDGETTYYVLDGQGAVKIGDRSGDVAAGSFVSVPRGMPFSVTRRGNKPLVMLWVLNGSRCEEAR
jgi:mannose-6-phosphate isomerase-like protein (cupin superfamily)